jgi:hypothetical protein
MTVAVPIFADRSDPPLKGFAMFHTQNRTQDDRDMKAIMDARAGANGRIVEVDPRHDISNFTGVGMAAQGEDVQAQGEIRRELDVLMKSISMAELQGEDLRKALAPVSRNDAEASAKDAAPGKPPKTPLGQSLEAAGRRIRELSDALRYARTQLEL